MKTFYSIFILFLLYSVTQAVVSKSCKQKGCAPGFRCNQNICVRNYVKRKLPFQLCSSSNLQVIKCVNRRINCIVPRNKIACGYTIQGNQFEFANDCLPCKNTTIKYFVRSQCNKAPLVCKQGSNCVNGKCVKLSSEKDKQNNLKKCIDSSQCLRQEQCMGGFCLGLQQAVKRMQIAMAKEE